MKKYGNKDAHQYVKKIYRYVAHKHSRGLADVMTCEQTPSHSCVLVYAVCIAYGLEAPDGCEHPAFLLDLAAYIRGNLPEQQKSAVRQAFAQCRAAHDVKYYGQYPFRNCADFLLEYIDKTGVSDFYEKE